MSTERATLTVPAGTFGAYIARPAAAKAPAIVVLQEIFGINAAMREICDGLAAQGFLAICPDLFWRIEPGIDIGEDNMTRAFELFGLYDVQTGMGDIQATVDFIRADAGCSGKVGAVGFCLGGLLAYLTGCRTDVEATVGYYGVSLDSHLDEAAGLTHPLLLHIAEEDEFVDKAAQARIVAALSPNPLVTLYSYPGRSHAFARPHGAHSHPGDAALAGQRSLDFFKTNLG